MSARLQTALVHIQTFLNIEEVRGIPGFLQDHPLRIDEYDRLVGEYHFREQARCCIVEATGGVCHQGHNHGWVVRDKNDKVTIIGNDCARKKFGAESTFVRDSNLFLNEKRRRERLSTLIELMTTRHERLARLASTRESINSLDKRVKELTKCLGPLVMRSIHDMVKAGRSEVFISANKYRWDIDTEGKKKKEISKVRKSLGILDHLELGTNGAFNEVRDGINEIVRAFSEAVILEAELDVTKKGRGIDRVVTRLQDYDRVVQLGQELLNKEGRFWQNDFRLLCYLNRTPDERLKAASTALRFGKSKSRQKEDPSVWLSTYDEHIRKSLNADSIEID